MKIGILSTNTNLYSTRRLIEAGIERGHEMPVINHRRCYMNITSHSPGIHYKGSPIEGVDARGVTVAMRRASAPDASARAARRNLNIFLRDGEVCRRKIAVAAR